MVCGLITPTPQKSSTSVHFLLYASLESESVLVTKVSPNFFSCFYRVHLPLPTPTFLSFSAECRVKLEFACYSPRIGEDATVGLESTHTYCWPFLPDVQKLAADKKFRLVDPAIPDTYRCKLQTNTSLGLADTFPYPIESTVAKELQNSDAERRDSRRDSGARLLIVPAFRQG